MTATRMDVAGQVRSIRSLVDAKLAAPDAEFIVPINMPGPKWREFLDAVDEVLKTQCPKPEAHAAADHALIADVTEF